MNLRNIKEAMAESHGSNPARPWWMELALNERKKTPEEKRSDEIKEGIITACVGLSLIIFLHFLLDAVSIGLDLKLRAILHAVSFAGLIPFLIGLGITFHGLFLSKRLLEGNRDQEQPPKQAVFSSVPETAPVQSLPERSRVPVADFSVTETTTTKLQEPAPISANRETS